MDASAAPEQARPAGMKNDDRADIIDLFSNKSISDQNRVSAIVSSPKYHPSIDPCNSDHREPCKHATSRQGSLPSPEETSKLSPEDQARLDEEASVRLAQALMAEEALASYSVAYRVSMDYLRNHQDQFSQEDLEALEAAMEEDRGDDNDDDAAQDGNDYDMLMRLGEQMGDVKSERWALMAQQQIDSLKLLIFDANRVDDISSNDCDFKCLICQCQYEHGDVLRRLPCGHIFHGESCVDQWLLSKDFCPYCRTSLKD